MSETSGLITSAPHDCPGTESQNAGKTSACAGCPNQTICASGEARGPDPDIEVIAARLARVKSIILIMSGKGGVGKSTLATNIARALATNQETMVGLLDIDICGPSIPVSTGLEGESIHSSGSGWSPVYLQDNLAVISCGFLLESADSAVIWRGPKKHALIKQFVKDVDWSDLDFLVIDTPPGTSDEHLSLVSLLKKCDNVRGAILICTPQSVAVLDVRKQLDFCEKVKLPVLGLVENMAAFTCGSCGHEARVFRNSRELENLTKSKNIELLASIPLDPKIAKTCDEGTSCFEIHPESSAVKAFLDLASKINEKCSPKPSNKGDA